MKQDVSDTLLCARCDRPATCRQFSHAHIASGRLLLVPDGEWHCHAHAEQVVEGKVTEGMNVVILDDVITTGRSVMKAITPVEKLGAKVVHVLVLVDREESGINYLREQGFNADPIFTYSEVGLA